MLRGEEDGRTKYKEAMQPVQGHTVTVGNCFNFVFSYEISYSPSVQASPSVSVCTEGMSFAVRGGVFLPTFKMQIQQSN